MGVVKFLLRPEGRGRRLGWMSGIFASMLLGGLLVGVRGQVRGGIDLLEKYPTTLTEGDIKPQNAREWEFTREDIYYISEFSFEVDDALKVDIGPADLGIGHCRDGAVWAVVMPREKGTIESPAQEEKEEIEHLWLRFHPAEVGRLFPAETVISLGNEALHTRMLKIANTKIIGSWQADSRAVIPGRKDLTVDADTTEMVRRFFVVDRQAATARYVMAFENNIVPEDKPFSEELVRSSFDRLWQAYERQYAMFVLRPEVNWQQLRQKYQPQALKCTTAYEFAQVCAEMLKPLRDLHIWVTVDGQSIPVFDRPRQSNANPLAYRSLIGSVRRASSKISWAYAKDKIGFIVIDAWQGEELVDRFDEVLERMRDTRGLIIDVRLNGGGSETSARDVAGRFADKEYIYSYSQFRNGDEHTDLTEKYPRQFPTRGPWRYDRPVTVLIGQKCMSSNESFIAMMAECPQVTTMGDHTCGSSGNPTFVNLPGNIRVSLPRWIDLLADGEPLDERGVQPDEYFPTKPESFTGERDDLLQTAIERMSQLPLPEEPIAGESIYSVRGDPNIDQPKVIAVRPANRTQQVETVTNIRIKFDRPMNPHLINLKWDEDADVKYENMQYNEADHEFVISVKLDTDSTYTFFVNLSISSRTEDGFRDLQGSLAEEFHWSFSTKTTAKHPDASPPKLVSVNPASGTQLSFLSLLRVKFDQPMNAKGCRLITNAPKSPFDRFSLLTHHVVYDPQNYQFILPVVFPLNRGSITLAGFQSEAGVEAEDVTLNFSTGKEMFSADLLEQLKLARSSPTLKDVLEKIKQQRRQLTALSETVLSVSVANNRIASKYGIFKMQGAQQFFGDASKFMHRPFMMGSDGEKCWFYQESKGNKTLTIAPSEAVPERNVVICDPFLTTELSAEETIKKYNLQYLGTDRLNGRPYHLIRSWSVKVIADRIVDAKVRIWWIDAQTYMPLKVECDFGGSLNVLHVKSFIYSTINEVLDASEFSPVFVAGVKPQAPEPLEGKYHTRLINVMDGSNGIISINWGKRDDKGSLVGGVTIK